MTTATAIAVQKQERRELGAWQIGCLFVLACAVVVSRRPDAVTHAQFYTEDGRIWFAEAYNMGWWHALFRAYAGYFQTFSRLGAALALLVPLAWAPLVTNVLAIGAQALPAAILLSPRSAGWGSLRLRAMMAVVYLALPNSSEIGFGITESQWVLALSAFLLLVAEMPRSRTGRALDLIFLLICGLSGPFCIFLLPIAAIAAWKRKERWRWAAVAVLGVSTLAQAYGLLVIDRGGRPDFPLGASFALLTRILGGNVVLGVALGRTRLAIMPGTGILLLLLGSVLAAGALAAFCFLKSTLQLRLLWVLAALLLAASMISPTAYPPAGESTWQMLAGACGVRYWLFPSVALAWSLLWCARRREGAAKVTAGTFLAVMAFTIPLSWRQPAYENMHWAASASSFAALPAGTAMTIPENPRGWVMTLVKHSGK